MEVRTDDHSDESDAPRTIRRSPPPADQAFRHGTRGIGIFVLVLTGSIGLFLGYQVIPTVRRYGFSFFSESRFLPEQNIVGIYAAIVGSIEIAVISLAVAFPLALLTALYITEYAPLRLRGFFISVIDLMAAVPSIVYGVCAIGLFDGQILYVARWLSSYFGWIPIFKISHVDPQAAFLQRSKFELSPFNAGLVVALMVIPLACAVMRNVFSQAPVGEREAALALAATRWGVIRSVVLPFGRGGIVGGTMLGLGRALGETVAVLLIVSTDTTVKIQILANGSITISSLIANGFDEATSTQLKALLAAGFVLFVMTLMVNTAAAVIVNRSRSGAVTG